MPHHRSFTKAGIVFDEGDSAFVMAEKGEKPFIARILNVHSSQHGGYDLDVRWWYRPEDPGVPGGRQAYHGERELLKSDHCDTIHSDTVIGKCVVHSLDDYRVLSMVTSSDFYTRFKYSTRSRTISPSPASVPRYCVCSQPENPDRSMVECDCCQEWYHPECIGTTLEVVQATSSWVCSACTRKGRQPHAAHLQPQHQQYQQQQQWPAAQHVSAAVVADRHEPPAQSARLWLQQQPQQQEQQELAESLLLPVALPSATAITHATGLHKADSFGLLPAQPQQQQAASSSRGTQQSWLDGSQQLSQLQNTWVTADSRPLAQRPAAHFQQQQHDALLQDMTESLLRNSPLINQLLAGDSSRPMW